MSLRSKVSAYIKDALRPILGAEPWDRGPQRLSYDVIRGVLSSRSLMVSEIGRTLFDDPAGLWGREKRLCRGLASKEWSQEPLRKALLDRNAAHVKPDTLVVVDFSEVVKPYGKAFEYLDRVRDASDPRKDPPAGGTDSSRMLSVSRRDIQPRPRHII
jgi:hypothetical protein